MSLRDNRRQLIKRALATAGPLGSTAASAQRELGDKRLALRRMA